MMEFVTCAAARQETDGRPNSFRRLVLLPNVSSLADATSNRDALVCRNPDDFGERPIDSSKSLHSLLSTGGCMKIDPFGLRISELLLR